MDEPLTKEELLTLRRILTPLWGSGVVAGVTLGRLLATLDARDAEIVALKQELTEATALNQLVYDRGREDGIDAHTRECAEAVCEDCAAGIPVHVIWVGKFGLHNHTHTGVSGVLHPCKADPIRRAFPKAFEEGRSTS